MSLAVLVCTCLCICMCAVYVYLLVYVPVSVYVCLCVIARYQQSLLTLNESSSTAKATASRQDTPNTRALFSQSTAFKLYMPACLAFTGYACLLMAEVNGAQELQCEHFYLLPLAVNI